MNKNKLHYMEYYGDGDAKAFNASGLIDAVIDKLLFGVMWGTLLG